MKLKFSKKLKWLGIGAGLTALTVGACAPVLVSCSESDGGSGNENGGNNGGNGGNNQGNENVTVIPQGSLTPTPENVIGSIGNSFNLGSGDKTFGVSDKAKVDGTDKLVGVNEPGKPLANTEGFITATNSTDGNTDTNAANSFAFNLTLTKKQSFAGFAAYNAGTNASPTNADTARKFIFGNGASTGLINNEWIKKNNIDISKANVTWEIDSEAQAKGLENDKINGTDQTMELQFNPEGTDIGFGGTASFTNKNAFDFELKEGDDPTKDKTFIKSGYVKMTISVSSSEGTTQTAYTIPIIFNVIYQYKGTETTQKLSVFNDTNEKTAILTGTDLEAKYVAVGEKEDASIDTNWDNAKIGDWQVDVAGSTADQNILNIRVDSQNDIRVAFKAVGADKLINSDVKLSILNPDWLTENGFDKTGTGVSISWQFPNGNVNLAMTGGASNYIYTKNNIIWQPTTNTASMSSRNYTAPSASVYVENDVTLSVSATNVDTKNIPVKLRFVAPATEFNNDKSLNVLSTINDAALAGSTQDKLVNADLKTGSSINATNTTLNVNITNVENGFVAIKQLSGSELISSGLINETWLKQQGYDANSTFTWKTNNEDGSIDFKIGQNIPNKMLVQTINGSNYYVSKDAISWIVLGDDKSVDLPGVKLVISNGADDKGITIYVNIKISIAPVQAFAVSYSTNDLSASIVDNPFYESATGPTPSGQPPVYTASTTAENFKLATEATADKVLVPGLNQNNVNLTIKKTVKWFKFELLNINQLLALPAEGNISKTALLDTKFIEFYNITSDNTTVSWKINTALSNGSTAYLMGISLEEMDGKAILKNDQNHDLSAANVSSGFIYLTLTLTKDDGTVINVPVQVNITLE